MIKYEKINSKTKQKELKKSIQEDNLINTTIIDKYKLLKKLGKGSYGNIYLCKDIITNKFFAAKLENKNGSTNALENEYQIMKNIKCDRVPLIKQYSENNIYNILIMQLLGKSLEQIFEQILNKEKMSIKCVCNLSIQMIEILELIHNKNIIHRDIKPSNFLMGNDLNTFNNLYLIDFGLATKYRDSANSNHYKMIKGKKLIGTVRFASVNAMNGLSQSRRDDLESIGYVLIYFLKGKLPWQNLLIKNKEERYEKIREIKSNIDIKILCSDLPEELSAYLTYVKNLKYDEDPNYDFIKGLFKNLLNKIGEKFDYCYDWDNSKAVIDLNQYEDKKVNKDIFDDDNIRIKLPLNKIKYKKLRTKRNKSQDKSTNDEDSNLESEEFNNSNEKILLQNSNDCCTIM